jgi:hypothetical protein
MGREGTNDSTVIRSDATEQESHLLSVLVTKYLTAGQRLIRALSVRPSYNSGSKYPCLHAKGLEELRVVRRAQSSNLRINR